MYEAAPVGEHDKSSERIAPAESRKEVSESEEASGGFLIVGGQVVEIPEPPGEAFHMGWQHPNLPSKLNFSDEVLTDALSFDFSATQRGVESSGSHINCKPKCDFQTKLSIKAKHVSVRWKFVRKSL